MNSPVHVFDNGVKVFGDQLTPAQRERYSRNNLHEPEEESLFVDIVGKLPAAACFASVGTAVGYYALLAKRLRGDLEIHCYDPLPAHIECLKRNILLNGFRESDFNIHQVAISDRAGTVRFLENSYASSIDDSNPLRRILNALRKIVLGRPSKKPAGGAICVQSVTMGGAFALAAREKIEFVQMDIQGHELPVLREFFHSHSNLQALEFLLGTHGPHIHPHCLGLFAKNNYRIIADIPSCEGQPDGIIHCCLTN
jgi:FkbM family methyltransferase